jgi:diacylglycerol kinase family enzyme
VVRLLSPQLKTRLGKFAFVLTAMKAVYTYRFPWLTVRGAGREWRARQVIFGVTGYYAGPFRLGPSKPPAGMGRVVSLHGGRWRLPVYSAFLLAGRLYAAPAAGFSFEPSVGIDGVAPLELDGDSAGSTPVVLEMVPGAIRAFLR